MISVDDALLDRLSDAARTTPRLRKNHNLHPSDESRCHRLLNAIEPGSYIRPHRHLDPEKDESFILLRGQLGVIEFDDTGQITSTALLCSTGTCQVATIPHGIYHTAVSLMSGTIFFEAKAGPYRPLESPEKALWAPDEHDSNANEYLQRLCAAFDSP